MFRVPTALLYVSPHFMMHFRHKTLELAFYYSYIVLCYVSRLDSIVIAQALQSHTVITIAYILTVFDRNGCGFNRT